MTWDQIDAERSAFADLTDQLTREQWDAQSLCSAWKVRHVVAHLNEVSRLTLGAAAPMALKYGFRITTMLREEAIKGGARSTDELRTETRESIGMRTSPPGAKVDDTLVDYVVHQQDVRRPLGIPRTVPTDTMRVALDRVVNRRNPRLPGKTRAESIELCATDLDWRHGHGLEIRGSGEAILMALAGRAEALPDLSGPGVATLRERIGC